MELFILQKCSTQTDFFPGFPKILELFLKTILEDSIMLELTDIVLSEVAVCTKNVYLPSL